MDGYWVGDSMGRKQFGKTWWARRWLEVLEQFGWGNRLQRGRSYARAGRVFDVDIEPGRVRAQVQGRRLRPYHVEITVPVLSGKQWQQVIDAMAERAVFMAKLLAGEMPENIEEAFEAAGVHLFPTGDEDIEMYCSCPDWAVPCKHIAATFYVLGEMFDYDPFLIFFLRGCSKEEVIEALKERYTREEAPPEGAEEEAHALEENMATFWGHPDALRHLSPLPTSPPMPDMGIRRLGDFPDREVAQVVHETLARAYSRVSERALAHLQNGFSTLTRPNDE